ncbi:MAG: hypothetical protein ACU0CA_14525 [Paracoccaceae bacterium]
MPSLAIDTHKTINKLIDKGFTQEQAEGVVDALTESTLVTKDDLRVVAAEIKTWVAIMLVAQGAVIVTLQNLLG